jgi:hypothetical protein
MIKGKHLFGYLRRCFFVSNSPEYLTARAGVCGADGVCKENSIALPFPRRVFVFPYLKWILTNILCHIYSLSHVILIYHNEIYN